MSAVGNASTMSAAGNVSFASRARHRAWRLRVFATRVDAHHLDEAVAHPMHSGSRMSLRLNRTMFPFHHALPIVVLGALAARASTVTVDASRDRHPISPDIYGVMLADDDQQARLGLTVRRYGGNELSRYNWKTNTSNTGGDGAWFQTRVQSKSADQFVAASKAAKVSSMVELPLLGFVSNEMSTTQHCSYPVSKYGPQQSVDPADAECGNGKAADGSAVRNDPMDVSTPADVAWTREWVGHLVSTHGSAANGGVRFYNLGNQPALWNTTHRDVHPNPATYEEIKATFLAHAAAVKDADPTALTVGPGAWGWLEYFDSAAQDRAKTGVDFLPFYLQTARAAEQQTGRRLLDYLDIHVYAQAAEIAPGLAPVLTDEQRLRSTRVLWDPEYTVESWESCCYGGVMKILPRMHEWIAQNYPGTKLSLSGYSFGAIDTLVGALAQVDALGLFGRENVALATLEDVPASGSPGEAAFLLYRNYDGAGGRFGDTSIRATHDDPTQMLAAFSAFDAQGKLTTVLVNKATVQMPVTVKFSGAGDSGPLRAFQLSGSGTLAAAGSAMVTGGTWSTTLPARAAMLIEYVPAAGIGAPSTEAVPESPDAGTDGSDAGVTPEQTGERMCGYPGELGIVALLITLLRSRQRARMAAKS